MKKLIALLMILCLASLMIPAGAETDITGNWVGTEIVSDGVTYRMADVGMAFSITLNPDGTLVSNASDGESSEEVKGTWSLNGNILTTVTDGDAEDLKIVDGKIIYTTPGNGMSIILCREGDASTASSVPNKIRAASGDEFIGTWKLCSLYAMDMYVTADQFAALGVDDDLTMQIQNGKVVMSFGGESLEFKSTFSSLDGALAMTTGQKDENNMASVILVKMTDQGLITLTMNMEEMKVDYFLAKQ